VQKADNIIEKVGLPEVREVMESELDKTQQHTGSRPLLFLPNSNVFTTDLNNSKVVSNMMSGS
jgi:hypothetical protein